MANQEQTYFLPPTFDNGPNGVIQLGSIIAKAKDSEMPLNRPERIVPPADTLEEPKVHTWEDYKLKRGISGHEGIWTKILPILPLKLDLGVKHDNSKDTTFHFDRLELTRFFPTPDYIRESAKAPEVKGYMKGIFFNNSIFMVTRIWTAFGVTAESIESRKVGVEADLSIDGAALGVPDIPLGPEGDLSKSSTQHRSYSTPCSFVFAFRLHKIKISRKGAVSQEVYSKGAMYGLDDKPEDKSIYEILGLMDDDSPEGFHGNYEKVGALDHDGESVWVCIPS